MKRPKHAQLLTCPKHLYELRSGGLLSGHPVIAAGLIRIAETVKQIRGDAGEYQVENAKTGIAHGVNGLCGQSHCVWVLDRDK